MDGGNAATDRREKNTDKRFFGKPTYPKHL